MSGVSRPGEASMASSGLIAPVTGRRYVKAWRIDEYIASALEFYRWTEDLFQRNFFYPVEIVRFLANEEARKAWEKRREDESYAAYISGKTYDFLEPFNRPYGILTGGYRLDTTPWLDACRNFLKMKGWLIESPFVTNATDKSDRLLVWASGSTDPGGMHGVIPNKGEALLVRMPEWNIPIIVKEDVFIIPIEHDLFWVGSYYQPWPEHPHPSEEGKQKLLEAIHRFYSGPVIVMEHFAGVRPTVDDRRPLIGPLPGHAGQYMFNGMGTKGTSLAPFWAGELISHLTEGVSLSREVSPDRY